MDHGYVTEQIWHRFSQLQSGDELRPLPTVEPPPSRRVAHIERDVHRTYLVMGVLAPDMKDEGRYAVKLIDQILGTGGSSRLSRRLREDEKRVYTVYSVAPMYEDTGCFAVCTACSPENVPTVESLVLEEWEKLGSEPVSDDELKAAKSIYEGALTRDCETNLYVAGVLGIEALLHQIEAFEESIKKINAVTKEDVMEAASQFLDTAGYAMVTVGREYKPNVA
jgi:predicted Zn-dependent peptidase